MGKVLAENILLLYTILRVIQKSGDGKEAAQIFWLGGATIARIARRDE
jgi:hypothetical protein